MDGKPQKSSVLYSLPICILFLFICIPLGVILISTRLFKKGRISKKVKNILITINLVLCILWWIVLYMLPESNRYNDNNASLTSSIDSDVGVGDEPLGKNGNTSSGVPTSYEDLIQKINNKIDSIINDTPIDTEDLQTYYYLLLQLRTYEYLFKASAYGYFTGDYGRYSQLGEKCNKIAEEMTNYFEAEEVYYIYNTMVAKIYGSLDEGIFPYEQYLIGEKDSPNIDTMWDAYFENILETEGLAYDR